MAYASSSVAKKLQILPFKNKMVPSGAQRRRPLEHGAAAPRTVFLIESIHPGKIRDVLDIFDLRPDLGCIGVRRPAILRPGYDFSL